MTAAEVVRVAKAQQGTYRAPAMGYRTAYRVGFFRDVSKFFGIDNNGSLAGPYREVLAGQAVTIVRQGSKAADRFLVMASNDSNGVEGWRAWVDGDCLDLD